MDTPKETLGIRHQRAVIPVLSCGKIQCCPMKVKHHTDISIFRSCGTFYLIQTAGLTPCTAGRSSWLQQNHPVRTKKGDFCHLASKRSTKFSVFCWNVSSHACSSAESSLPHLHRAEICLQQALMPEIDLSRPVQQCLSKERKAFCVSFSVYCELQLVHVGRELSVLVFQE